MFGTGGLNGGGNRDMGGMYGMNGSYGGYSGNMNGMSGGTNGMNGGGGGGGGSPSLNKQRVLPARIFPTTSGNGGGRTGSGVTNNGNHHVGNGNGNGYNGMNSVMAGSSPMSSGGWNGSNGTPSGGGGYGRPLQNSLPGSTRSRLSYGTAGGSGTPSSARYQNGKRSGVGGHTPRSSMRSDGGGAGGGVGGGGGAAPPVSSVYDVVSLAGSTASSSFSPQKSEWLSGGPSSAVSPPHGREPWSTPVPTGAPATPMSLFSSRATPGGRSNGVSGSGSGGIWGSPGAGAIGASSPTTPMTPGWSTMGAHGESNGSGAVDDRWITVFGFAPGSAAAVLRYFQHVGEVVRHRSGSGNWLHIQFGSRLDAAAALTKNGKTIGGSVMVGVVPCTDPSAPGSDSMVGDGGNGGVGGAGSASPDGLSGGGSPAPSAGSRSSMLISTQRKGMGVSTMAPAVRQRAFRATSGEYSLNPARIPGTPTRRNSGTSRAGLGGIGSSIMKQQPQAHRGICDKILETLFGW